MPGFAARKRPARRGDKVACALTLSHVILATVMAIDECVALRYMTRFRCLGSTCEDTCCQHWDVPMTEPHYQAIKAALGETPEGSAELARAVRRLPVVGEDPSTTMAIDAQGRCMMLDATNLCSLQRRFGEALLPIACASFPRSIGVLGSRMEISGMTSCPEVTRLCLLADDGVDIVPFDLAQLGRIGVDQGLLDPNEGRFDEIRHFMLDLLRKPYPLASRLIFVAAFAHRSAGGASLDVTMASFRDTQVLERLHRISEMPLDEIFAVQVVLGMLDVPWRPGSRFQRLVARIKARYQPALDNGRLDPHRVLAMFREWRDAVPPHLAAQMEQYLRNYSINNIYQDWATGDVRLFDLIQLHMAQIAMLRFLLISHPETSTACSDPPPEGLVRLDAAAVECVFDFSRAAHHVGGLGAVIMRTFAANGQNTPAHAFALATL